MNVNILDVVRYDDKTSLFHLAEELRMAQLDQKAMLLIIFMEEGWFEMPWFIKLLRRVKGKSKFAHHMMEYMCSTPEATNQAWNKFLKHLTDGKNKTDPNCAGGYTALDLYRLLSMLTRIGYNPGHQLVSQAEKKGWLDGKRDNTWMGGRRQISWGY